MRSLVVLFAVVAVACAAPQYLVQPAVQPANTPAVFIDAYGRPLETAEVASARALHLQAKALDSNVHYLKKRSLEHVIAYSVPTAVSHQSRVDYKSSPVVVASAPVVETTLYSAPAVAAAPVAVSHQSRVDVKSSPAVVATAPVVATSLVSEPVVAAHAVYAAPAVSYSAGSAVTHQSRVDVHSSPALVQHQVVAPAYVEARSVYAPTVYATQW